MNSVFKQDNEFIDNDNEKQLYLTEKDKLLLMTHLDEELSESLPREYFQNFNNVNVSNIKKTEKCNPKEIAFVISSQTCDLNDMDYPNNSSKKTNETLYVDVTKKDDIFFHMKLDHEAIMSTRVIPRREMTLNIRYRSKKENFLDLKKELKQFQTYDILKKENEPVVHSSLNLEYSLNKNDKNVDTADMCENVKSNEESEKSILDYSETNSIKVDKDRINEVENVMKDLSSKEKEDSHPMQKEKAFNKQISKQSELKSGYINEKMNEKISSEYLSILDKTDIRNNVKLPSKIFMNFSSKEIKKVDEDGITTEFNARRMSLKIEKSQFPHSDTIQKVKDSENDSETSFQNMSQIIPVSFNNELNETKYLCNENKKLSKNEDIIKRISFKFDRLLCKNSVTIPNFKDEELHERNSNCLSKIKLAPKSKLEKQIIHENALRNITMSSETITEKEFTDITLNY